MAYKPRKRKVKKNVPEGKAFIHSTFNNTIVTISDNEGNVISWASAGTLGFKGSKKSTPFAAGMSAEAAGKAAYDMGMRKVEVEVKGNKSKWTFIKNPDAMSFTTILASKLPNDIESLLNMLRGYQESNDFLRIRLDTDDDNKRNTIEGFVKK